MPVQLSLVRSCNDRHYDSALLYHTVRTRQCVLANRIKNDIDIFGDVLKLLLGVIDRYVCAELLEEVLIGGRRSRDHLRPAGFCELDREASNST